MSDTVELILKRIEHKVDKLQNLLDILDAKNSLTNAAIQELGAVVTDLAQILVEVDGDEEPIYDLDGNLIPQERNENQEL